MAGPTASVLLQARLEADGQARCRAHIAGVASKMQGDDFWIGGRPFILRFGEEYAGEFDELAASGLPDVLGWAPVDAIGFAAMCNGEDDHRSLAELCLRFARQWDGLVDFCGTIVAPDAPSSTTGRPPARRDNVQDLAGVLLTTWYETANGMFASSQYGDAALLSSWLEHERFRMVK
jgi:Family of unknown function (DUF6368)